MWLRDNNTTKWTDALPIVQAMKNRRYHSGIKRSPYEAMFGKKMELGNENQATPNDDDMDSDIDLNFDDDEKFKYIDGTEWLDLSREISQDLIVEPILDVKLNADVEPNSNQQREFNSAPAFLPIEEEDTFLAQIDFEEKLNSRFLSQQEQRQGARDGQRKQAEKMLESSNKR